MSDSPDDASRWSWVTRDGKITSGAKGELMLALRSEKVLPSTLVWRPTWAEWLPATRVTELRGVLPADLAQPAQAPRRSATQLTPPALPAPGAPLPAPALPAPSAPPPPPVRGAGAVSKPPPAPVRAKGQLSQPPAGAARSPRELQRPNLAPRIPTAAGPVPVLTTAAEARPRGASILGPPRDQMSQTQPSRSPLPTLGGEEGAAARGTLRPPGAVPPPPRGAMGANLGGPASRSEDEVTPPKLATPSAQPDTELDVPVPTELRPAVILPVSAQGAPPTVPLQPAGAIAKPLPANHDFDVTLGSTPFESGKAPVVPPPSTTLESAVPSLAASAKGSEPAPTMKQWLGLDIPREAQLTLGFFLIVIMLGAAVMFAFVVARTKPAAGAAGEAAAAASGTEPRPSMPPGCRLLSPAARLATTVERTAPPVFAEVRKGELVAVGFAPNPKSAAGLLVRLDTLDAERAFDQLGEVPTRATVPLVKAGKTTFFVDHTDSELTGARTVADGVTLGFAGPDLVRVKAGQKTVLWPGAASEKTTDPRIATTSDGTLVTFRRGGLTGQVLYGWLGKDGGAAGLLVIEAPGTKFSGTPDAAASGQDGLVAFAGRPNDKSDWRIQLAKVPQKGKASARTFEPPPGGSGGGNIAPNVAALGSDGWLLQWTEGASGQYEVRMARLGLDLEVLGDTRLVSPKGANAGQGAVFASGSKVLSVFVQTTAGHDELWGASFECF